MKREIFISVFLFISKEFGMHDLLRRSSNLLKQTIEYSNPIEYSNRIVLLNQLLRGRMSNIPNNNRTGIVPIKLKQSFRNKLKEKIVNQKNFIIDKIMNLKNSIKQANNNVKTIIDPMIFAIKYIGRECIKYFRDYKKGKNNFVHDNIVGKDNFLEYNYLHKFLREIYNKQTGKLLFNEETSKFYTIKKSKINSLNRFLDKTPNNSILFWNNKTDEILTIKKLKINSLNNKKELALTVSDSKGREYSLLNIFNELYYSYSVIKRNKTLADITPNNPCCSEIARAASEMDLLKREVYAMNREKNASRYNFLKNVIIDNIKKLCIHIDIEEEAEEK